MVGGGVIGDAAAAKRNENTYIIKSQQSMFDYNKGVNWVQKKVTAFNPEQNEFSLCDGSKVSYEYLVVAPGC